MATLDQMVELTYKIRMCYARGVDADKFLTEYDDICRELEVCDILGCKNEAKERPWCREHHPYGDEEY